MLSKICETKMEIKKFKKELLWFKILFILKYLILAAEVITFLYFFYKISFMVFIDHDYTFMIMLIIGIIAFNSEYKLSQREDGVLYDIVNHKYYKEDFCKLKYTIKIGKEYIKTLYRNQDTSS